VFRALWDVRQNDTQRTFVSLGGENGLRGYPAQQFYAFGGRKLLGTVEYRSLPWLLESVHVGMALFYDVGSVYQRIEQLRFHHAAGAGLRVLMPQLNRTVFRIDAGVPLDSTGFTVLLTYGSEQYVALTEDEDLVQAAQQAASVRQGL
jgi:hemolysin activation/secretion protein